MLLDNAHEFHVKCVKALTHLHLISRNIHLRHWIFDTHSPYSPITVGFCGSLYCLHKFWKSMIIFFLLISYPFRIVKNERIKRTSQRNFYSKLYLFELPVSCLENRLISVSISLLMGSKQIVGIGDLMYRLEAANYFPKIKTTQLF